MMNKEYPTLTGGHFQRAIDYLFGRRGSQYIFAKGTGLGKETVRRYAHMPEVPVHIAMLVKMLVDLRNNDDHLPISFAPFHTMRTASETVSLLQERDGYLVVSRLQKPMYHLDDEKAEVEEANYKAQVRSHLHAEEERQFEDYSTPQENDISHLYRDRVEPKSTDS